MAEVASKKKTSRAQGLSTVAPTFAFLSSGLGSLTMNDDGARRNGANNTKSSSATNGFLTSGAPNGSASGGPYGAIDGAPTFASLSSGLGSLTMDKDVARLNGANNTKSRWLPMAL